MSGINPGAKQLHNQEILLKPKSGMLILLLNIVLMIASLVVFIYGIMFVDQGTMNFCLKDMFE